MTTVVPGRLQALYRTGKRRRRRRRIRTATFSQYGKVMIVFIPLSFTKRFLDCLILLSVTNAMTISTNATPKVAVIGAGAAGLSTARLLSKQGINPLVLEKEQQAGGVWRYVKNSRTAPMYRGLRTNLPKEIMAFREKPWTGVKESFVKHSDVLAYLEDYEEYFDLKRHVSFGSSVTQLTMLDTGKSSLSPSKEEWPKVRLEWSHGGETKTEEFDGIFVCNGHYALPSFPNVVGLDENFKGRVLHSVSYDNPEDFRDETVLCVGGRASGADLAREISLHAKQVYLSDTSCELRDGQPQQLDNVVWVPKTEGVRSDGTVKFEACDMQPHVDTIILCSGYDYSFPFINENSNLELHVRPGERRVLPLYEQLWHARCPNVAFIGLPHSVLPFPLFELQAEAVWAQWTDFSMPDIVQRQKAADVDAASGGAKNGRIQDTHFLGDAQWNYCRKLANFAGILNEELEKYIETNKDIYDHAGKARKSNFPGGPDSYRSIVYKREGGHWEVQSPQPNLTT